MCARARRMLTGMCQNQIHLKVSWLLSLSQSVLPLHLADAKNMYPCYASRIMVAYENDSHHCQSDDDDDDINDDDAAADDHGDECLG